MAKERVERDEEDLVRLYLTDIGQYPLLTKDDEVRLAQAIEGGNEARVALERAGKDLTPARKRELRRSARDGEDAERTFVQSNLRLVVSIAANPAPSKKSVSTSTSPASASVRSRRGRCRSFGTRRATPALAISSPSEAARAR